MAPPGTVTVVTAVGCPGVLPPPLKRPKEEAKAERLAAAARAGGPDTPTGHVVACVTAGHAGSGAAAGGASAPPLETETLLERASIDGRSRGHCLSSMEANTVAVSPAAQRCCACWASPAASGTAENGYGWLGANPPGAKSPAPLTHVTSKLTHTCPSGTTASATEAEAEAEAGTPAAAR